MTNPPKKTYRNYGASRHTPFDKTRYQKMYYNAKVRGLHTSLIDAAPIRAHALALTSVGMTPVMIAAAAGCSRDTVDNLLNGEYAQVRRETAARVMAVTTKPHPEQALCLAVGALRRVQALNTLGWSLRFIAARLSMPEQSLWKTLRRTQMTYTTWAAIRDTYDELSGTPGPNQAWAKRARKSGYIPPLAWHGIDIDDPCVQPKRSAMRTKLADQNKCRNGHDYTNANTYVDPRGRRNCQTCRREANRRRRIKRATEKVAA
jgi:hypothetical protein